jgi:Lon protease-like protein
MAILPLFPLGTVLLPGARIPLQLFEQRYLELARDLAERSEDDRRFGVTLIRAGREVGPDAVADLYEIGCEARVDAMALAESAIGTVVHLVATGARRYRLEGIDTEADTPWTTGRVTWLDEPAAGDPRAAGSADDPTVEDLADRALREHTAYLLDLGAKAEPVEAAPTQLAYRIVEAMVLDASDRQRVLEGADPATRLRTVIALLRRERAIVGRFGAVPTPPMPFGPSLN